MIAMKHETETLFIMIKALNRVIQVLLYVAFVLSVANVVVAMLENELIRLIVFTGCMFILGYLIVIKNPEHHE